jgi:hypothetical protein
MKWIVFTLLIVFTLPALAQKRKKTNWLRKEATEAETWFTFCGKQNGKKVKAIELIKANEVKVSEKLFDGLEILGMEVVLKIKTKGEERFSCSDTKLSTELKTRIATLVKDDMLFFYVKIRNRSTQVVSIICKHLYLVV